jgi:hypothetical protein
MGGGEKASQTPPLPTPCRSRIVGYEIRVPIFLLKFIVMHLGKSELRYC